MPGGAAPIADTGRRGDDPLHDDVVPPVVAEVIDVHDLGALIASDLRQRDDGTASPDEPTSSPRAMLSCSAYSTRP